MTAAFMPRALARTYSSTGVPSRVRPNDLLATSPAAAGPGMRTNITTRARLARAAVVISRLPRVDEAGMIMSPTRGASRKPLAERVAYCSETSSGPRCSRQDVGDHVAVNVRQAEVTAAVVERESLVVETEQVQDRGVPVVDVHRLF